MDARASRVVETDEWRARVEREVHDLADLLSHDLAEGSPEYREVLGENEHLASVDRPPTGYDGVTEWSSVFDTEAVRPMTNQHVGLDEAVRVQQLVDALTRRQFVSFVLPLYRCFASLTERLGASLA